MTAGAIIALLTTLLTLVVKVWPDKKSDGQVERDRMKEIHDADQKFEETQDTTDLGKLP